MSWEAWWWLTLALGLVVTGVVAFLLRLILQSARRIRETVAEIWVVGPQIAANTAHLALLQRINTAAGSIVGEAQTIGRHAERIQQHAAGCPGCPYCVIGWSGR